MMPCFITLEGSEGVGKSTALSFIRDYWVEKKLDFIITREPGGTELGESIRNLLLHHASEKILPETELLLMFAARAQHIAHVIQPALKANKIVVSDRFTDASFAYQGGGRCMDVKKIEFLSSWIQDDCVPTLTILLDAPVDIGLSRIENRGHKDRIEQEKEDFFERVRQAYLARARAFPGRFVVIDAMQSLEAVQQEIKKALDRLM